MKEFGLIADCAIGYPITWKDRLRWKLFPANHVDLPIAPVKYKDCFNCRVTAELSFLDRVRILFSGRLVVETKTVTENEIGGHLTSSTIFPLAPKFLEVKR